MRPGRPLPPPARRRDRADPAFQGFGRVAVDAQGRWRFRTLRPVAYCGRAPHIHAKVKRGARELLTTQLYVEGDPGNARDFLWRRMRRRRPCRAHRAVRRRRRRIAGALRAGRRGLSSAARAAMLAPCSTCSSSPAPRAVSAARWREQLQQHAGHTRAGHLAPVRRRRAFEQWTLRPGRAAAGGRSACGPGSAAFDASHFASASLINNAALLTEPQPLADSDTRVAVGAPRASASRRRCCSRAAFLRATRAWAARRRVLHISSGLGRRGMASSAPYCAVKAGLDNLARAQALEEALQPNGAKVVLAGAGRHRYRHAGAAARRRPAVVSRPATCSCS